MTLEDYVKLITAIGGFISVAAGVYKLWSKFEADRLAKWQRVAVYSIINDGHPEHLSFASIRAGYIQATAQSDFEIRGRAAKDSAILAALLTLIGEGAISRTPEGNYVLIVTGRSAHEFIVQREAANRAGDALLRIVLAEDGHYSPEQLRVKIEPEHPGAAAATNFHTLFWSMVRQGMFQVHDNKVHLSKPVAPRTPSGA